MKRLTRTVLTALALALLTACGSSESEYPASGDGDAADLTEKDSDSEADSDQTLDGDTTDQTDKDSDTTLDGDLEPAAETEADTPDGDPEPLEESEADATPDGDGESADREEREPEPDTDIPAYEGPGTILDYIAALCPWRTACESDLDLYSCFGMYEDDHLLGYANNPNSQAILKGKINCLRSARSCDDYEACTNGFLHDTTGVCKAREISSSAEGTRFDGSCDGNSVVRCVKRGETYYISRENCSDYGLTCMGSICLFTAVSCDEAFSHEPCSGNFATWCSDFLHEAEDPTTPSEARDCTLTPGAVCGDLCEGSTRQSCSYGPKYGCRPKEREACSAWQCDGVKLKPCDDYGFFGTAGDCRLADESFVCTDGLRCTRPVGQEECTEPTDQYGGEEYFTACEGTVLRTCVGGKWLTMDCSWAGAVCSTENKRCEYPEAARKARQAPLNAVRPTGPNPFHP